MWWRNRTWLGYLSRFLSSGTSLVGLSVVLFVGFGGLFYFDGEVKRNAERLQTLIVNSERIQNADRRMTAAVRLAAALESDRFLLNYQNTQDTKYALLDENTGLVTNARVREALDRLVDIQSEIEDAESEAIALIDEENWEDALDLVTGPEFQLQKGIYRAALSGALREMIQTSQDQAEQSNRLAAFIQYGVLGMFAFLALIGFLYSREMRRSFGRQSELAKSVEEANVNLEVANVNLEQRVLDRTAELDASRTLFKTVLDNMPAVVFLKTPDGRFELVNRRYEELYGVSLDSIEGRTVFDVFPGEIADDIARLDRAALDAGGRLEREHSIVAGDEEKVMDLVMYPVHGAEGEMTAYGGFEIDITKRKQAERALAGSEEWTRLLLQSVGEGVFGVDLQGRITFVNPPALAMLEFEHDELIGNGAHALFHYFRADGSHYPVEECPMYRAFTFGEPSRIDDEVLWRKGGSSFPVEYSATPMISGDAVVGSVVTFRDITERKAALAEVEAAHSLVTDSIRYASRIQRSFLPKDEMLKGLFADHFAIWKPRDVVGGDMYWIKEDRRGYFCVLFDCTGHGVPGALMTTIAVSALDVAFTETGDPARLMARANQYVKNALNQHSGVPGESDDGLEMGICLIEPDRMRAIYAGARFDLIFGQGGEFEVIKGEKSGIGYRSVPFERKFTNHLIRLRPGQRFYLYTDGVTDQIGGPKGRAFGRKRLIELIKQSSHLPMSDQREHIVRSFAAYQGAEPRRDDVSLFGFTPIR